MKLVNRVFALAAVVLLAGCWRGSPMDMANRAQPVGSPFTKYLSVEYRILANTLSGSDADFFARKSLAAVDGMLVAPESPVGGKDRDSDEISDMVESRGELMTMLENGGRDRAPDLSAVAQVRYDCWVSLHKTLWRQGDINFPGETVSCREQFQATLDSLKQALSAAQPPAAMPPPPPAEEFPSPITSSPRGADTPLQQLSYLVFFDWNKYNISDSARDVLDTAAHDIRGRSDIKKIIIRGYTDASGGEKYNLKLSQERADAVRKSLIAQGIPASKIRAEGRGKSDLLIKTRDGVREAQNRRVQITFE